jgi:hypothetical protein
MYLLCFLYHNYDAPSVPPTQKVCNICWVGVIIALPTTISIYPCYGIENNIIEIYANAILKILHEVCWENYYSRAACDRAKTWLDRPT